MSDEDWYHNWWMEWSGDNSPVCIKTALRIVKDADGHLANINYPYLGLAQETILLMGEVLDGE